jgi:hypothetical protein
MEAHVSETDIERLALGRLPTAKSIRVQRHLFKCGPCLQRLIGIEVQLAALELIAGDRAPMPEKSKPLFIVHDTADGFVYSRAEERRGAWYARHWGKELDGGRDCGTMAEANEFLIQSFSEMFPEHRCTERCQLNPVRRAKR